ncbi:hypothetical protein Mapa_012483 [Marchantia paleacea]|nr:hypothetical protein Mapa_012483 [Marchantia paleacea]
MATGRGKGERGEGTNDRSYRHWSPSCTCGELLYLEESLEGEEIRLTSSMALVLYRAVANSSSSCLSPISV